MNQPNSSSRQLRGWDAATWRTTSGDPIMRSTVGGLMLLEKTPDLERLVERVERMTLWFPVLRQRLVMPGGPLAAFGQPRLVVDPDFDVRVHVSHVAMPPPGSWDQVLAYVRRLSLTDLDRDRPLWRAFLISGLEGGKAAAFVQVSHAVADGQGMVQLLTGLVDYSPEEMPDGNPTPPAPEPDKIDPFNAALKTLNDTIRSAGGLGKSAVTTIPTAGKALLRPDRLVKDVASTAASLTRVAATHRAPLSELMTQRSTTYSYATLDIPFAQLRAASKAYGNTLNDAYVAGTLAGMRIYHARNDVAVETLRMNLPVSIRTEASAVDENAVMISRLELDASITNPGELMAEVHEAVVKARSEPALYLGGYLAEASRLIPVAVIAEAAKASDFTTSNVPGPPIPLWLSGASILRIYPVVPTIGAAVNLTVVSYAKQTMSVGITTDDAAVGDVDDFVDALAEGFAELGVNRADMVANPLR